MILVWDTGALYGLTTFRNDFIDNMRCDLQVKVVTKANRVIGIGTTLHRLIDRNGQDILLTCISYCLTHIYVRLYIPRLTIKCTVVTMQYKGIK